MTAFISIAHIYASLVLRNYITYNRYLQIILLLIYFIIILIISAYKIYLELFENISCIFNIFLLFLTR